ncbi:MAG: NnrS family protein [bacterium]|nr:NnrS family protein [bacterium]
MTDTAHTKQQASLQILCNEPFRVFFPLGFFCSLIGVSHWLWYYSGLTETYSCHYHGLFQIQGFEIGFAAGFLMTALPRFLETPPARPWELFLGIALYLSGNIALYLERWIEAEIGFLSVIVFLLVFAARRFPKRQDTPPPDFLFIPFGFLHALAGGLLILYPLPGLAKLGPRLVEQGMLLSFTMGIGPYLGARLLTGQTPDFPPLSPTRLFRNTLLGLALFASFWVEAGISQQAGLFLRALAVSIQLFTSVPLTRPLTQPLWHLRFLRLAFFCIPAGLWLAALVPDYEILALHITFIGGFAPLTFIVATRVITSHCGFEPLWQKNTRTVVVLVFALFFAFLSRMISDLWVDYYFGMLHIGAGFWLLGAIPWGLVWLPRMTPRHIDPSH